MKVSKDENLTEFLLEVKEKMAQIVNSNDPDISSINAYIFEHPGKLIRSKIIQIFGTHLGIKKVKMLELATASELIHLSTLIHDDIIDEADLRRGNETIIKKWGLKQALLYGDYLYTKTFSTLNSLDNQKIAKRLIDCAEELIEGEFIQIKYHQQDVPSLSNYMEIVDKKTGALFKGMLECIGLELNFSVNQLLKLGELGREFGFAFQLNDDLADFQEERVTGKESFKDLSEGRPFDHFIDGLKDKCLGKLINSPMRNTKLEDEVILELQNKLNTLDEAKLNDTYWEIETGEYLSGAQVKELENLSLIHI